MDLKKIILLGGVGLVSAAVGVLLPTLSGGRGAESAVSEHAPAAHDAKADHAKEDHGKEKAAAHEPKKEAPPKADPHAAGGHGAGGHGGHGEKEVDQKPKEGPVYLHFDRLVANLNEPQMVKFISIDISIQTDAKFEEEVKMALESTRPKLKTWLTSHLADKTMEDIRGKVGFNRLRREIQDNFNSMMFKDGHERVQDILFEEFYVP